ncbi:MAG: hypothetical protein V3T83_20710, partial [Acidobacteriota bacterium]
MFEHQRRIYSTLLLAVDISAGILALWIAYQLRSHAEGLPLLGLQEFFLRPLLPLSTYFIYWLVMLPFVAFLLRVTQGYSHLLYWPLRKQYLTVLIYVAAMGLVTAAFSFAFQLDVSRPIWLGFLLFSGLLMVLNRLLLHWAFRSRAINEHNRIKILIVGTDQRAAQVSSKLSHLAKWGYEVVGHLASLGQPRRVTGLKVLGRLKDLPDLLNGELIFDEILFVGSQQKDPETFAKMIRLCEDLGIRTRVPAGDLFPNSIARVSLERLDDL